MRSRSVLAILGGVLLLVLLAFPALPQGLPTGTLAGHVVSADKQALPGVTVGVTSPNLQGVRNTTTNGNGDFLLALLPPGDYQVSFEIEGFRKAQRSVKVSAAQNANLDVEMILTGVAETIVVTGAAETVSASSEASTTYPQAVVEKLPTSRALEESVLLTAGVNDNGPHINGPADTGATGAITISGSQSYENLFLVNGVVVNENVRGQALPLYIEDAVQETTTSVSAVSAEYGRFAGGVVNVITKSGGNELHGSFRTNFSNDNWEALNPKIAQRTDKVNERYEATLGGWAWKDHLWYFGAGRKFTTNASDQTVVTGIPYAVDTKETRGEAKLTLSPTSGQSLVGSYIRISRDESGNHFQPVYDVASLVDRQLPQELLAVNYNGIYTQNFFAEAQYSQRKFTFQNAGSTFTDLIKGTLIVDRPTGFRYNSPTFCGVCRPEKRDNDDILVKGTWFLSGLGSHDVAFGYDTFKDVRVSDNHQSGSDFRLLVSNTVVRGQDVFPVLLPGKAFIQYNPIAISSKGTDFRTNSGFINDRWRLNDHLSFNVGLRLDVNNGVDSQGRKVAKDSKLAPRLAAVYDVKKDGDLLVNASYNVYTTALANTQGDATSAAGNPATIRWLYQGPAINPNPVATSLLSPHDAISAVFNWFDSVGGINNQSFLALLVIPGGTTVIHNSLKSPSTDEYTIGAAKRLGDHGLARVDYVHRKWNDFYVQVLNTSTGKVNTSTGPADLAILTNTNSAANRKYDGLHVTAQYRAFGRLNVGAIYTLSWTKGNFDGETGPSGPISADYLTYPEYKQVRWNSPDGYLATDERHRARAWAIYDFWRNDHNALSGGIIQSYFSGTPYGAVGSVDPRKFVTNPGYAVPPTTVNYYYTARDAFRTNPIVSTDLTLDYSFHWGAFSKDIEVFMEPQVLNVFNRKGALNVSTAVLDPTNSNLQPFNPFTQTPVEGVNWRRDPKFGKPQSQFDFQPPRTFRFSVGLRF
jgi:outer membrane receptor for ferrienterochelin and colicin